MTRRPLAALRPRPDSGAERPAGILRCPFVSVALPAGGIICPGRKGTHFPLRWADIGRAKSFPPSRAGDDAKFEVSATFGEGAIVALVDPETSAIRQPLYDAESTSGRLSFSDGEETTIVWTRMSGADGALVGEAITSDGDALALSIEQASGEKTERPFVLFAAASASLFRGICAAAPRR